MKSIDEVVVPRWIRSYPTPKMPYRQVYRAARGAYRVVKRAMSAKRARVSRPRRSFANAQLDQKIARCEGTAFISNVFTASAAAVPTLFNPLAVFYASMFF